MPTVAFLEGVGADEVGRHLAGDADQRDRIHHRVGETRDRVGRAGTGGHQHHARLTGGAGIALGRVHRPLLMADQDVANLVLVEERIVDGKHRAARITEDMLNSLVLQGSDHHFGSGHRLAHLTRSLGSFASLSWNLGNKKGP